MPNVGVLNLNTPRPANQALGQSIGQYLDLAGDREVERRDSAALEKIYNKYRGDQDMIQKTFQAIQTNPEISNHRKVSATKDLLDMERFNTERIKATEKQIKNQVNKDELKQALIEDGYPDWEADLYVNSTPGVQQRMAAQHIDLKSRGARVPLKQQVSNQQSPNQQPVNVKPENNSPESANPNSAKELPVEEQEPEWPEIPLPPNTTPKEQEDFRKANQKENNKILAETRKKTDAIRGIGVRLNLLSQYSPKVPDGAGRIIIDPNTGEPYPEASLAKLVNKETQAFVKTLNDFLSEAKNYFGGRVTNFDVQAFKSRLPGLLNTEQGRRLIIKQMQLINDLESVHAKTEEDALKHYGRNASYSDIVKIADNKVIEKEKEIIDKINVLVDASNYMDQMAKNPTKYKDTTLMQDDEGKFRAVKNSSIDQKKKLEWQIY